MGRKRIYRKFKTCYKGTSVKVIGAYPGGINTNFYKDSRNYVTEEKQHAFMNPIEVANTIMENILSTNNLTVADIIIERN